jgi:hypothetical protein
MHSSPPLFVMDYVGPVIGAAVFVLAMSLGKGPDRRTFNAILDGACGATGRSSCSKCSAVNSPQRSYSKTTPAAPVPAIMK